MNDAINLERREALRRFKPHPAYKDSGIEWLGKIPAHWKVKRLKTIATVQLSNVDKKSVEGQEVVRLCNYVHVYYDERITADPQRSLRDPKGTLLRQEPEIRLPTQS